MAFIQQGFSPRFKKVTIRGAEATPFIVENSAGGDLFTVDSAGNSTLTGNSTVLGNLAVTGTFTQTGAQTLNGDVTVGDNIETDALILKARLTTSTEAGAALTLDADFTYGEANELRYTISNWTGIGGTFRGFYLRAQSDTDSASAELRGMEILAVPNASAVDTATGLISQAYVKGDTTETITNLRGVHGEVSFDAGRANSITLTAASPFYGKVLAGKVADYTKFHGVLCEFGDMDGGSRTFGNGLLLQDSGESGTSVLTNGVHLNMACTTGLRITGNVTTGILIAGTQTDAIRINGAGTNLLAFDAVEGAISGTPGTLTPTHKVACTIDGVGTVYFHVGTVA